MASGFLNPSVLFRGLTDAQERAFLTPLFRKLKDSGRYDRFVECCAGGFGNISLAVASGWTPDQIEASDVQLFSAVLGCLASGEHPSALRVRVDGRILRLPKDPVAAGARILWSHLEARMRDDPSVYGQDIAEDVKRRQRQHEAGMARKLAGLVETTGGLTYYRMGIFEHLERVLDRPGTVVNMGPPSVTAGYEKFYDTKGVVTWDEPSYRMFDVDSGLSELVAMCEGRAALTIIEEQQAPRHASHPTPIYARDLSEEWRVYLLSNRPEEIFELTGGPKVAKPNVKVAAVKPLEPIIPKSHPITRESSIEVRPLGGGETAWLRDLWVHRLPAIGSTSYNFVVVIDGFLAGLGALTPDPIIRPYDQTGATPRDALLMRFAVGAPHESLRLTRLVTKIAMNRRTAWSLFTGKTVVWADLAEHVVTVEYSRFREAKGLRGLMKRKKVVKHPAGWALHYSAPIEEITYEQALADWLDKEETWQKTRELISETG